MLQLLYHICRSVQVISKIHPEATHSCVKNTCINSVYLHYLNKLYYINYTERIRKKVKKNA